MSVFYGAVINPESLTTYRALPRCLLLIGPDGTIDWMIEDVKEHLLQDTLAQKGLINADVTFLQDGEFLIPGFIDTHTHAPQFLNLGSGQQYELLDWLQNVTFPAEAKFADLELARCSYHTVVKNIISFGTTTCCYYGTLHLEATKILADIVHSYGQRAFVGKCNMNRNSPDDYIEHSTQSSVDATRELITYIRSLSCSAPEPLVKPILTPRFAISCTDDLLEELGKMASSDPHLHIQTHISENHGEVKYTKELFPKAPHYAGVYDMFGLLRYNTVLAHGVLLEDEEIDLIAKRRAGISHCPVSNFNLRSGIAPIGKYLDCGVKVGLGTDVSGGFSPSILTVVQHASVASKVMAFQSNEGPKEGKFTNRQLPVATLFYLATLGGAEVCDIDKQVGSFAPGKSFDALLVNVKDKMGNPGIWGADVSHLTDGKLNPSNLLELLLERFLFCGDDRNIMRVYVQGKVIGG
ncbi:hypothetical protein AMATHDRAFT_58597 [Amanita thiersii Skay4041]|uniref:Guanine deaminase n=1 Tax=Amanita thiersii Skay4041 TaxID=703135 RepID=A0A2A9NTV9_9AGAR|nr:hypothetical protein AMATHDRAFT_58597 [Amanita thiersii Skay4041]